MGSGKSTKSARMRLDAYLARAGMASRREARILIRKGAVNVDGESCRDAARLIEGETVTLFEESVESPVGERDFVLNKPPGVACSDDEREAPLVRDLYPERLRRRPLRLAGRLDRATTGLLIVTTDGDFVHALTHPRRKLAKRYRIEFDGELVSDAALRVSAGLELRGDPKPTLPAELTLGEAGKATLVLEEGRTHQVRRMIRALGGEVTALHRDRVGAFNLPADLEPGAMRPLAAEERALLLNESSL